jgi:mono/diheme cytochrome c family protein
MTAASNARFLRAILLAACLGAAPAALADVTDDAAAPINEKYSLNVKKLFATKCSWCHQGYGMKQADGPKLAGTDMSFEQVVSRIITGKSPMPGFRTQLKPEEVQALAEYIKALPAD